MYCNKPLQAPGAVRYLHQLILCLVLSIFSSGLQAAEPPSELEVWLITYGPGEIYWERFGHNAIWIRDESSQLDHLFNFGFFDFEQEAFFSRFLLGRLLYFSAAQPAEREFSQYINADRSIRAQRLNLTESQSLELAQYLLEQIRPENRDYLYDYYTNNCSTRIRDAIDLALGGALSDTFETLQAEQNWRDHTRRLTVDDFWLYLGLEIGLGPEVDRDNTRWEEFFIPSELARAVADFEVTGTGGAQPLVLEDVMLSESSLEPPPEKTGHWWPRYLLLSAAILVGSWLASSFTGLIAGHGLVRSWLVLAGVSGCLLVFFWFFTDHQAAQRNLNLLLLNPLWLFIAFWKHTRIAGGLLIASTALAALAAMIPGGQYNLDVLAVFGPLNIAAGLVLLGAGRR